MKESGKTTFMKAFMQLAGEKLSTQKTEFELNLEPFYFGDELIQAVNAKKNTERTLSNGNG